MTSFHELQLRKLICNNCCKYLSIGPVRFDENSFPVCGRCVQRDGYHELGTINGLLEKQVFPCSFGKYGCKEQVTWINAKEHEATCEYSKHETVNESKTYSLQMLNALSCWNCENFLNVAPIVGTGGADNQLVCGRCSFYLDDMQTNRQIFVENLLKPLRFPCKNHERGCKTLLAWGEAEEHESQCQMEVRSCPIVPLGECHWSGTVEEMVQHFHDLHPDLVLDQTPTVELNLNESSDVRRMFLKDTFAFMLFLKLNAEDKVAFWSCVRFLGDRKLAQNFQHRTVFVDVRSQEEFALKKTNVADRTLLHMVELESVHANLEPIASFFGNPTKLLCSIEILVKDHRRQIAEEETTIGYVRCRGRGCDRIGFAEDVAVHAETCAKIYERCKWPGCTATFASADAAEHQDTCPLRPTPCKWGCDQRLIAAELTQHEATCDRGTVSCKWNGCSARFARSDSDHHQERCDRRPVPCDWPGCAQALTLSALRDHRRTCSHRIDRTFTCDLKGCSYAGDLLELQQHLRQVHPEKYVTGPSFTFRITKRFNIDAIYVQCHAELFRFWCSYSGFLHCCLERFGRNDNGSKYYCCSLESKRNAKRLTRTVPCNGRSVAAFSDAEIASFRSLDVFTFTGEIVKMNET